MAAGWRGTGTQQQPGMCDAAAAHAAARPPALAAPHLLSQHALALWQRAGRKVGASQGGHRV